MSIAVDARSSARGTYEDDSFDGSSTSESEYQHALEIVLENENVHRRKSSMGSADIPRMSHQRSLRRNTTACQVHQLLEAERRARKERNNERKTQLPEVTEDIEQEVREVKEDLKEQRGDKVMHNGLRDDRDIKGDKYGEGERPSVQEEAENIVHSRLLTKRQLSDMTWGVRELSKKLGKLRLRLKVQSVFLLTKVHDEELIGKTRELAEWLLDKERDTPYIVWIQDILEKNEAFDAKGLASKEGVEGRLKYWNVELCQKHTHPPFDFVVSLGGDGTVLFASWLFQRIVPPTLSFALGSLGFLTKFDFDQYQETLGKAFKDGVMVSLRLRFEGTVMRSQRKKGDPPKDLVEELIGEEKDNEHTHKPDKSLMILNDIVVDRGPNATMSAIELFGDDEHFTTVQADGVCVATPTGSTAYNLAAGGSLCHPDNPVILVTAICAHTLSFRPIILPDTIVLRVGVPYDARTSSWASFDGRERVELNPGDYVTISASRYPFANVMPDGRRSVDWVNSISRTLNWNTRQPQKAFKDWDKGGEK